ncbi:MAG: thermonuclease family protein [Acidobacteriota bacterium]
MQSVKSLVTPVVFAVACVASRSALAVPKTVDATVAYVMTGDSAVLDNGKVVRYIGVDAPSRGTVQGDEPYAKEAFELNKRLVAGKRVRLELDAAEGDEKGRIWAYVYVGKYFVNASLVESGLARTAVRSPNTRFAGLFQKLEQEARGQKRGLWKAPAQAAPLFSNKDLEKGYAPPKASFGNKDLERFDVPGEDDAVAEAAAKEAEGADPAAAGADDAKGDGKPVEKGAKVEKPEKVEKKDAPRPETKDAAPAEKPADVKKDGGKP